MKKLLLGVSGALLLAAAPAAAFAQDRVGDEYMVWAHEGNEAAKADFLKGLALLHSFEYDRAAEAFRDAQAADPDWVMAYWGEAMTHNHPVWFQQDRDAAIAILERLDTSREGRLAKTRSQREAMWLDAIETLYGEGEKEARDFAYLDKMRAIHEADPDDIDARAFYALALIGTTHNGRDIPTYMQAAGVLEPGFMDHPMHPGVLHYLIHSYDDPVHAPLGLRAAERYAEVAPDAGHAQHMVSHIFTALGMWEAAEDANVNADVVVDRQRLAAGREQSDCGHYNQWLSYARLQQGKDVSDLVDGCRAQVIGAVAEAEGAEEPTTFDPGMAGWSRMAVRRGVDTGVWPEPMGLEDGTFMITRFNLAYGDVLASRNDPEAARDAVARMQKVSGEYESMMAERGMPAGEGDSWIKRQHAQAEAIVALAEGRTEKGLAMLEAAAAAEAAMPVEFGPPAIPKPSYELLGDELRAAGRHEEARAAYEKAQAFAPGRRLTLAGLAALDE
ncbi:tetratricopeptide repeat protein [Sphingomicrobium sediminis]|uniref:Tetratricopeptide repeat protein n=1 Tax=Sphingomicrobium sediminis TaxID=2950949 RepID=A0A9X2EH71_9SPHN|nr:hypothetical protein [Sphingomicrobium sediminis]MCM8556606.1 hypothetical protein [Sphingomicrobium sediminis]